MIIKRNEAAILDARANLLNIKKAEAIAKVNEAVGKIRSRFITVLPGQDMIYQSKEAEAIRYLNADPAPDNLTDYPFIQAEVGVLAESAYHVASIWAGMSEHWRGVAAGLESVRMTAINAIEAATDGQGIHDALVAFETVILIF